MGRSFYCGERKAKWSRVKRLENVDRSRDKTNGCGWLLLLLLDIRTTTDKMSKSELFPRNTFRGHFSIFANCGQSRFINVKLGENWFQSRRCRQKVADLSWLIGVRGQTLILSLWSTAIAAALIFLTDDAQKFVLWLIRFTTTGRLLRLPNVDFAPLFFSFFLFFFQLRFPFLVYTFEAFKRSFIPIQSLSDKSELNREKDGHNISIVW